VEVDEPASLRLGDAELVDLGARSECTRREALRCRKAPSESVDGSMPERRRHRVPDDRSVVVEAVLAQRRTEGNVVVAMALPARGRQAVLAGTRTPGVATSVVAHGVDSTKRRRGQRCEEPGARSDVARESLTPYQTRDCEEERVASVASRARGTQGSAAILAGDAYVEDTELSGLLVLRDRAELDRVRACTGIDDLAMHRVAGLLFFAPPFAGLAELEWH